LQGGKEMVKSVCVSLLILFIAVPLLSGNKNWTAVETNVYPAVDIADIPADLKIDPGKPIITASPGDTVGTSWYDYQHNGTISKMIVNEAGCVQYDWMNGLDFQAANRHCFYNFGDPPNDKVGVQIDPGIVTRSGYITLDVLSDGRAVPAYHAKLPQWPGPSDFASAVAVDLIACLGAFNQTFVDTISLAPVDLITAIWPHVAVDPNDNIHVVAHQGAPAAGDPAATFYSRSTDQGNTFSTWVEVEDSIYTISYDIQTSRSSGRVAISYAHGVPWDPGQVNQDLYYVESMDNGVTWDFANPINLTNYSPSDTMRAYADVSTIYDNDDSLHFAFSSRSVEGDTLFFFASAIMHWSKETGINVINSDTMIGWHSQYGAGAFRMMADRPSLGIDPTTGNIYCMFVGNVPGDTSAGGFPNSDLFVTCSGNGGFDWSPAVNVTNSASIGCTPGNCDDDDYPSLAEIVDDNLHILYVNDKDAGGIVQTEGSWTLNPILYLKVPKSSIVCATGTEEEKENVLLPKSFTLAQNVPNPFGTGTTIAYTLPVKSSVALSVYDITGREVANLLEGEMDAGYHTLRWDGKDNTGNSVSAGVYFYRLQSSDFTQTRKLVVLR
jgi:hypothetical protein